MIKERFVKVNGIVYYETELKAMPDEQLYEIIAQCKQGIDEIQDKLEDYKVTEYEDMDIDHYNEVVKKFESASVYLQADVILIEKILKYRHNTQTVKNTALWYKTFFELASKCLLKSRLNKIIKETDNTVGFSLE